MSGEEKPVRRIRSGTPPIIVTTTRAEAQKMLSEAVDGGPAVARKRFKKQALAQRSGEEMGVEEARHEVAESESAITTWVGRALQDNGVRDVREAMMEFRAHRDRYSAAIRASERAAVLAEVEEALSEIGGALLALLDLINDNDDWRTPGQVHGTWTVQAANARSALERISRIRNGGKAAG